MVTHTSAVEASSRKLRGQFYPHFIGGASHITTPNFRGGGTGEYIQTDPMSIMIVISAYSSLYYSY